MAHRTRRSATCGALLLLCAFLPAPTAAQESLPQVVSLDATGREAVVLRIGALLEENYVFPEVAERTRNGLTARLRAGDFDSASDPHAFAARVTEALLELADDRHLRVRVRDTERASQEREDPARARAAAAARARAANYGFQRVEILEGNVGYVEMRFFDGSAEAKQTAAAAMGFLANADALIFDMRRNGGGSPDMVRYVSSWLFDEPTHLNSLYFRAGDSTTEFWTLDEVPGVQRPDVPVFVLTSARTFSGAEEFSYNLRTQERATLIGEVTGGGANPGRTIPIDERFEIFVPGGTAINPITGTNWEGVGVEPHVAVSADEAYDVALEMARAAAAEVSAERGLAVPEVHDVRLPAEALAAYEGVFALPDGRQVTVAARNGQLFAQATGQPETRLMAQGEHVFIAAVDFGIRIEFTVEDRRATGFVLRQGGGAREAPRVR